jgi:AraC-like DNA-binding protein
MEEKVNLLELADFVKNINSKDIQCYSDKVAVINLEASGMSKVHPSAFPLKLNALTILFIVEGDITIIIDYNEVHAKQNSLIVLVESHVVSQVVASSNFVGYHLAIDTTFFKKATHEDKPPLNGILYDARQKPLQVYFPEDFVWLIGTLKRLCFDITRKDHGYQNSLILNDIATFAYEIWNKTILDNTCTIQEQCHSKEVAMHFLNLVFQHCKREHEVSYYAQLLCLSPAQLSRIVKNVTGKSALYIIHDIILSEAKIQMNEADKTFQQIAEELNFSDQASFSKFFKKKTGLSPREFKSTYNSK